MPDGGDEEGDECCHGSADMGAGCGVDVAAEEVVYGNVPFAGEFEPVDAVPPVGVEVSVCEACWIVSKPGKLVTWEKGLTSYLGESTEYVLEYYEEDEQEGYHEGEEEHGDGFS